MDLSDAVAEIHMKIDAKNLVTRARTAQLPEPTGNDPHDFHVEKGSLFRKYSSSCSHFNSKMFGRLFLLTFPLRIVWQIVLTKSSAKADTLITAVKTMRLLEVDVHPNFRTLMEHKPSCCMM